MGRIRKETPAIALALTMVLFTNIGCEDNPTGPVDTLSTTISFYLPAATHVRLSIYDIAGQLVTTLVDEVREAGTQRVRWSARDDAGKPLASGVYFYWIDTEDVSLIGQMVLVK